MLQFQNQGKSVLPKEVSHLFLPVLSPSPVLALMFSQPCGEQGQGIDPPETQHYFFEEQ